MTRPIVLGALLGVAGCYLSHTPGESDAGDAGADARAMDAAADGSPDGSDAGRTDAGPPPCRVPAPVDLLLVIDNSGSMREEQATLARELPQLVEDLTDPPDADEDGRRDWRPVRDLHFGVVTADLQSGPGCTGTGALRDRSGSLRDECQQEFPRFLSYDADEDDVDEVSEDYGCVALAGVRGCGVEQPLEAAIKALLPNDSELDFIGGEPQGDTTNAGFLRDDSLLAVLVLTDEDDCSFSDPTFFSEERELPACLNPGDDLYPIERYERAFRSLRPDRPDLFAFGAITGITALFASERSGVSYDTLLSDPGMEYREVIDGVVEPACESARGRAIPARRLVQLASRFGDQSVVGSICQGSYRPVVGALARLVGTRACEEFE